MLFIHSCTARRSVRRPHSPGRQHGLLSGVSAASLRAAANGRALSRRHGGPRAEGSRPATWPHRAGQLPGQLQVRAPGQGRGAGGRAAPLRAADEPCGAGAAGPELRGRGCGAGAAGLRGRGCGGCGAGAALRMLSRLAPVWACLLPEDRAEPSRARPAAPGRFDVCRRLFGDLTEPKTPERAPASNNYFTSAFCPYINVLLLNIVYRI